MPTDDAVKKLAIVPRVTSDFLLFEPGEREPGDDMKLRFVALATKWAKDYELAKAVLDAMFVKSQVSQALEGIGKTPAKEKD